VKRRVTASALAVMLAAFFATLFGSPAIAATVNGTLQTGDKLSRRSTFCDTWTVTGVAAGTWVTINLNNAGLRDPWLYVFNGSGGVVAENDDWSGLNSYIGLTWQTGYYIGAAAFSGSGGYQLVTNFGGLIETNLSCSGVAAMQNQTITFTNPGTRQYRPTFTVSPTASSGLAVSLVSNTTGICTVSGFTVTQQSVGTCTLTASQAGNGSFNAAPNVSQSFTITTADQAITFGALSNRTYSATAFAVSATASSGLSPTYSSLTTSVCTVSGANVTMLAEGTCTVRASQAGNSLWNAAANVDRSFTISKASQTITFGSLASRAYSGTPFTVSASSTSDLTVTIASRTTGVCTVSGTSVTMVSVGTCTLQASQAGNTQFLPAVNVDQSFSVTKASQTITFGSLSGKTYGDANFTVSATSSASLTVGFASSTSAVCTVSGTSVSIVAAGTCTITASQDGDALYSAASPVSQSFTVARKAVTATATLASRPYNGSRAAGSLTLGSLVGLVPGESLIVSATASDYASASVGSRTSTITYTLADGSGGGRAANYTISSVTATGEITQRQLTITANSVSRRTDAASPTFSVSASGLVAGESVSTATYTFAGTGSTTYGPSTTAPSATTVGTYSITPSALVLTSPASAANYDITYAPGSYAVTIGAATQLSRNATTLSGTSGSAFTAQPVFTIQDAGGNTVTTGTDSTTVVTATITSGVGGTLVGTTTATAFEGVARFTNLGITGSSSTTYTITYSAALNGVSRSTTQTVQPTFGAASALRIRTNAATARAGVALGTQPVIDVVDQAGNVVTNSTARVSVTVSTGGTLSGTTTVSASSGIATFSGVALAGAVTSGGSPTYDLTFSSPGLTSVTQSALSLSAGLASRLSLSNGVATSESGAVFTTQPRLTVLDAYGNTVTQSNNTVQATLTQVNSTGTLVGGLPGQSNVSSAGLQARFMRGSLSAVKATKGVEITTATSGYCLGGSVANLNYPWGSGGPGGTCGSDLFAGYWSGYVTSPVTKTVTFAVTVDDGFYMTINNQAVLDSWVDQGGATYNATGTFAMTAGVEYPIKIWFYENAGGAQARLFWNGNNTNTTEIVPTAAFAGAPGPSVTATALTNSSGQATFSGLGLNGLIGTTYTVTYSATIDGQTLTTTQQDVLITSGTPRTIRIDRAPAGAVNGVALTTQPIVTLLDSAGNPISLGSGKTVTVTASIPGMTATGATATVTSTSNGAATFSGLTFTGTSGAKTLTFTATESNDETVSAALASMSTATSSLTVAPGAATGLAIRTNSSTSLASGATLATQPIVAVVDASGNTVTTSSATITVSLGDDSPVGTLLGTAARQAVAGFVTYSGLGIRGPTGTYRLSFAADVAPAAGNEVVAQSDAERIAVTYGAAAKLVVTRAAAGAASGAAFTTMPIVEVQDVAGNVVANSTAAITMSVSTGATIVGTAQQSAASGSLTYSGVGLNGTNATTYTITYSASGLTSATQTIAVSTGAATKLALTRSAVGNQAGIAFTTQPIVSILDSGNNVVTTSAATVTATVSAGGSLVGTAAVDAASGVATFGTAAGAASDLGISGTAGTSYTVTYASGSLTSVSQTIVVRAGPATALQITTSSSSSVASGAAFATQPVVRVVDAAGNVVTTSTDLVTATVSAGPAGSAFVGTAARYPTNGVVTFSGLGIRGTAGSYTLQFTSGSLTAATQSTAVTVTFGAAAKLVVSNSMSGTTAASGAQFGTQPVVQVQDSAGNVVTNSSASITASVSTGATLVGTATANAASGVRTFTNLGINGTSGTTYTMTYSSTGLTSATHTVVASTGEATKLALTTSAVGDQAGVAFTRQPVVSILDSGNNVVGTSSATVSATVSSGGSLVGTATATAASGVATFGDTAGTADDLGISGTAGTTYTVTYGSGSLTSVSQSIIVRAGPATALQITTNSSSSVASGSAFATQPVVKVVDAAGNTVTTSTDLVTATIVAGSPDGTLVGTSARYPTNGVVTFSGLGIRGVGGSYTLRFTSGSLTAATQSSAVTVTFGPANKLVVTSSSHTAASGAAVSSSPVVQVQDISGNVVTTATPTISVAVSSGGSLAGTTSVAATAGEATFSNVRLTGVAGRDYTLTYSATVNSVALTPATHTVAVSVGAATRLAINQASVGTASGASFTTQPWISILDSGNNLVSTATDAVTATVSAGGTLVGTASATGASGIAKFTNLGISGTAGTAYTITYAATGLTPVTQSVTVSAGVPTQLVVTTTPSTEAGGTANTGRAGMAFGRQPVIEVRDAAGNKVTTSNVRINASIDAAVGSLVGNATADAVAGVATFGNLGVTATAGSNRVLTYTATLNGVTKTTTSSLTVSAGTARSLAIDRAAAATVNAAAVIPSSSQPIISFRDLAGNVVADAAAPGVTVTVNGGVTVASGAVSASDGTVEFGSLTLTGVTGDYTATYSSPGVTPVSQSIAIRPGRPTKIVVDPAVRSFVAASASVVDFSGAVKVTDAAGNVVDVDGALSVSSSYQAQTAPSDACAAGYVSSRPVGGLTVVTITRDASNVECKWRVPLGVTQLRIAAVGGGGGGGWDGGSGGGGGELRQGAVTVAEGADLTLAVGAGGASQSAGSATTVAGAGIDFVANGGGAGGAWGGWSGNSPATDPATGFTYTRGGAGGTAGRGGTGTAGGKGGDGPRAANHCPASTATPPFIRGSSGSDGPQIDSNLFGTAVRYGGGGGGGIEVDVGEYASGISAASGGGGGGGRGTAYYAVDKRGDGGSVLDGQENTGGGGGAGIACGSSTFNSQTYGTRTRGGAGASGVILLAYETTAADVSLKLKTSSTSTVATATSDTATLTDGRLALNTLRLDGPSREYTLTYSGTVTYDGESIALTGDTQTIEVTPGTPTTLEVTTDAVGAASGSAFNVQPTVALRDASGNLVTGAPQYTVRTTLVSPRTSTVGGTTSRLSVDGVAAFQDLSLAGATGAHRVAATTAAASDLQLHLDAHASYTGAGSTTWVDLSGNGRDATLYGAPAYTAPSGGSPGYFALTEASSQNDYATIADDFARVSFASGLTIQATVDFLSAEFYERVIDFGNGAGSMNVFLAREGTTNNLTVGVHGSGGTSRRCAENGVIASGLNNYAVTFSVSGDTVTCTFYVNGVSQGTPSFNDLDSVAELPPMLARSGNLIGDSHWDGADGQDIRLANLLIYNRGLTASEVAANALASDYFEVDLVAGAATKVVAPAATTVAAGATLSGTSATIQDASSNAITSSSSSVSVAITNGPTGYLTSAQLNGTTNRTAVGGVASFNDLSIAGPTGTYTLTYSSGALTVGTQTVTVTAGTPTSLALTSSVSQVASGALFDTNAVTAGNQPVVVEVRDAFDNVVATYSTVVTATVSQVDLDGVATGVLVRTGETTDTTKQVSPSSGIATFTNLGLTGTNNQTYRITFSSGDLTPVTMDVEVDTGAATSLAVVREAGDARVGLTVGVAPIVELRDSGNNPVTTNGVEVTASVAGGPTLVYGAPSGTPPVAAPAPTTSAGRATFTGLTVSGSASESGTNYTVTYSSTGLTSATQSLSLRTGNVSGLTVARGAGNVAKSGSAFTQSATVTLGDPSNNAITQATGVVTASLYSGTGTLLGTTSQPFVAGVATFDDLGISGLVGAKTIRYSATFLGATYTVDESITLIAGDPVAVELTTPAVGTAVGTAFSTQPKLTFVDRAGNTATSTDYVKVSVTPIEVAGASTGSLTGVTLRQASAGVVDFGAATSADIAVRGTVGQTYRISYTVTNAAGEANAAYSPIVQSVTVTPGVATSLVVTTEAAGAAAGAGFTAQPRVEARDVSGNVATSTSGSVTLSITNGATGYASALGCVTGTGCATVALVDGVATFSNLKLSGLVGTYTLSYSVSTLTATQSLDLVAGAASQLVFTTEPSGATSGSALTTQPVVRIADASGNVVSSASTTVTVTSNKGSLIGATAVPTVAGVATFDGLAISGLVAQNPHVLTFSATDDDYPAITSSMTLAAGAPVAVTLTTPAGGTAVGAAFSPQPTLTFTDRAGNTATSTDYVDVTVEQIDVNGTLTGALSGTTRRQATAGVVDFGATPSAAITLTGTAGQTYRITYTVTDANGVANTAYSPIVQSVTATPGAATSLVVTTEAAGAAAGAAFTAQPRVEVRDVSGNVATSTSGTVVLSLTDGPTGYATALGCATGTGCESVALVDGVATFANLKLSGLVGAYTLSYAVSGLTATQSLDLAAGTATKLVLATEPAGAASGSAFTTQPVVRITDASGNVVSSASTTVTVTSSAGTLLGAASATTVAGVATFDGVGVSSLTTANPHTFTFSSTGNVYTAATSSLSITAGPAVKLSVSAPSSAQAAVAFGTAPQVSVLDAGGNVVTSSAVEITAKISAGADLFGTSSPVVEEGIAATASSGLATFSDLAVYGTSGTSYVITYSADGLVSVSQNVSLTTGPLTQLGLTQSAAGARAGVQLDTMPKVQLLDAAGNNITTSGIAVTAAIAPIVVDGASTGTLQGTTTVSTDANGLATFTDLKVNGALGLEYTLTYSVETAGVSAVSQTIVTQVGPASQLAFARQPSSGVTSGAALTTQPVVQVQDAAGNALPESTVPISVSVLRKIVEGGTTTLVAGGTVSYTAPTTTGGLATFTDLAVSGTSGGSYRLSFASAALTVATFDVSVSTGAATTLAITTNTGAGFSAPSGNAFSSDVIVEVRDSGGNVVNSDAQVAATISCVTAGAVTCSGATLNGDDTATASSGVATFATLGVTGTSGHAPTVTFSVPGLTSASFSPSISAGSAARLTVVTSGATAPSGTSFGVSPQVAIEDAGGNRITTGTASSLAITAMVTPVTVSGASTGVLVTSTGDAATSSRTATATNGLATFPNLGLTGAKDVAYTITYTATDTSGGGSTALSGTEALTVTTGPAVSLALTTESVGTASGAAFTTQPVVTLRDSGGNTVTTSTDSVTATVALAAGGTGGSLVGTSRVALDSGVAAFTNLGLTGTAGTTYRITYTLTNGSGDAIDGVATTSQDVTSTVGAAASIALTASAANAVSGQAFGTQPVVTVRDSGGNTVTSSTIDVTVTLTGGTGGGLVSGASAETSVTASAVDGVVRFGQLGLTGLVAETYELTYTAVSLSGAGSTVTQGGIAIAPGASADFGVSAGAGVQAPSGVAFSIQPVITIRDAQGNTVTSSSARVTAAITQVSVGGSLTGELVGTTFADAENGIATFNNLGITGTAGTTYTVTFSVAGLTDQIATYAVSTGPATQVVLTRDSVGTAAGAAFTTQPQVTVRDSGGNTVTSYATTVTATITQRTVDGARTGELVGTATATPSSGVATFGTLGIGGKAGVAYTITYGSGSLTTATQVVTPTPGAAIRLSLSRASSGTVAGREFAVQPRLRVFDAFDNTVTTSTDVVTATVSVGGTLIGTTARSAVDGIVAYTNLGIRGAANTSYTVSYSLGSFAPTTETITLTAGPAYRLSLETLAAGAASGARFTTQPVLQVKDSSGNLVTSSTATVTASVAQVLGSGTITGTTTATASGGIITFSDLGLNGLAGTSYLITFRSTGLLQEQQTVLLGLGSPATLSLVQQSVGTASGAAFVVQPRVAILDAGGNVITTSSAAVLASVAQVSVGSELTGALVGTASQAASSGIATFTNLGISGRNTTAYTVSYTVPSLPTLAAVTQTITPTTGAASALRLTTAAKLTSSSIDSIVVSGAVFGVQPQLTVVDSGGNRVTSFNDAVTASVTGAGGSLVGTRTRNAISGIVTYTDLGLAGVAGTEYEVTFSGAAMTGVSQELEVIASLPGSVPVFSAPVSTEDGMRVTITNHDPTFTYDAVTSIGARAAVGTTGVVLVTGAPADTAFTLIVSSSKTNHRTESASVLGRSLPGLGLIPVVGTATATVDGFTAQITNFSTEFAWSVTTSVGRGAISSTGALTVSGVNPMSAVTATITTTRLGHSTRSFTTGSVTTLSRALTPTFAATTRTQGGFTTSITNFDPDYTYTATVSSGGTVSLNNSTGAITVTGLSDGTLATVLIVTSRATYANGSGAVQGQALSAALTPVTADPVATATGFTVDINNYDAAYTWTPSVTSGSVMLAATSATTARATVTLASGVDATLTIGTGRTGHRSASATSSLTWTEGLRAVFGSATSTTGGFAVPVTNHSADYTWSVSATSGTAAISNSGVVTVTGMTGATSTVTVSTRRNGYTSLGSTFTYATTPGLEATFGTPSSTSDGFTVSISNYDAAYTWSATATQGGTVVINGSGLVTVTGLQPGTTSTLSVLANRTGYSTGVATVSGASTNGAALTPTFGSVTRTEGGFTVAVTSFSSDYRWTAEITAGDTAGIAVVDEGTLIVSNVAAGQSATATVTATRSGYDNGTATVSGSALSGGALIPVYGRSTATSTGFSVPITNYDSAFTWAATATGGATATVASGTVTVSGLSDGQSSTVTVAATRSGRADGSSSFTGAALTGTNNTLAASLTPTFGTPTGTANGFRVSITNYDASYTWAGVTSRNATVSIAAGVATVSGLAASQADTLYVTTNKSGSATGSASVNGTALATGARPANLLSAGTVGTLCSTSSPGGEGVTNVNDLSATTAFSCLHATSGAVTSYTPNSTGFYTGNLGSYVLTSVTFTSAANAPERDPLTFTLWGCAQQNANCSVIVSDARTELSTTRGEDKEIALRNSRAFAFYKLTFGSVRGTSHALQIAEVSFAGSSGVLPGFVPTFGTQTPDATRAVVPISNFSPLYDWSLAVTGGARASLDRVTGNVTVANVAPASTVTLTVTTRREGYATESASIPVTTTSGGALVPTLSTVRATTTGASARIENYDTPGFTWSAATTSGGVAVGTTTIGTDGFVRVTGVPAGTAITITVTTARENYATGTNYVETTVLSPALVTTFGTPTRTSDGFTVQIVDYATLEDDYEWTFAATAGGQVSVNDTGLVTVSNLGPGVTSTLTVTTRGTDLAPASATLVETSIAPARIPTFDAPATTARGFEALITNYAAAFTWTATTTAGTASIVLDGASATVVATDPAATVTVSAARTGYVTGSATLRRTMTAALEPEFDDATVSASGFTVQIDNYDATNANWSAFITPAGTASINGSGLVTVSGVPVGAEAVLNVRTSYAGRHSGEALLTVNLARAAALTPAFASPLSFGGGFTVQVSNYSSDFSWVVSASSGAAASIDTEGLITVTGVSNAESTTVTVTTTRVGYATGTATTTGSSRLSTALTPTLGVLEPTADGFTVEIVNYDADFTWTGQVDNNGMISISEDGIVTVSGVPGFTEATATITASRTGYASGTSTVAATSTAGTALVPQFGVSTSNVNGYTVPLRNFDSRYTWTITAGTASGVTATIDATGVITVNMSGLSANAADYAGRLETVTVRTSRIGFLDGAADFTAAARSEQSTSVAAFDVTTYAVSGGTATLTTSATHGFAVGNEVFVSGVATGIDGVQTVSAVNAGARTFSFLTSAADAASTALSPAGSARRSGDFSVDVTLNPVRSAGDTRPDVGATINIPYSVAGDGTSFVAIPSMTEEADAGYRVVTVRATAPDGANVSELQDAVRILFDAGASNAIPVTSSDNGLTWEELPQLTSALLPAGERHGYYRDDDGTIWIYSRHLTMFGMLAPQAVPVSVTVGAEQINVGATTTATYSGGEGVGALTIASGTPSVCSVTQAGLVTGLSAGTCTLTATRTASGRFLDATGSATLRIGSLVTDSAPATDAEPETTPTTVPPVTTPSTVPPVTTPSTVPPVTAPPTTVPFEREDPADDLQRRIEAALETIEAPIELEIVGRFAPNRPAVVILENGRAVEVTVARTTNANGFTIVGPDFTLTIESFKADGTPAEIDVSGRVVIEQTGTMRVTGEGFAPNAKVKVWAFSEPIEAAEVTSDADGRVDTAVSMPAELAIGEHTVQLNGVSPRGDVRSVNVGVMLVQPTVTVDSDAGNDTPEVISAEVDSTDGSGLGTALTALAAVAALVGLAVAALAIARRPRRRTPQA
jgi:hypothetical protein